MPRGDYPAAVLDPIIDTMRSTIERDGGCMNMAGYCRRGKLLLTVLYSYPDGPDGDPDALKEPITVVLGRIGRAVQADLVVTVQDIYYRAIPADSVLPANQEDAVWDDLGGRPSEHAERIEALWVLGYTADGIALPSASLSYGRDDHGRPVWHEWDALMPPDLEAGGLVPDAWKKGLTEPPWPLQLLVPSLASLLGRPTSMFVFDEAVASALDLR